MQSMTIPEWCARRRYSRRFFYSLLKAGKAPRILKVGTSVRITEAADAEWLNAREAEADEVSRAA